MKKIWIKFLVLLILCLIWIFSKMLPNIYLNIGRDFYLKHDYISAYKSLNLAYFLNPKGSYIRYYYVQTLKKLKPTLTAQREIYNVYNQNLPDTANLLAEQRVLEWREQILSKVGKIYIEKVPFNNEILRWDTKKFPIIVGIDKSSNVPNYYVPAIESAFFQWQKKSDNLVSFKITNDLRNADIKIKFAPYNAKNCEDADCKYVVAYTQPKVSGEILKCMTITFYDSNNLGKPFSEKDVYNTALHEIGHSLGIMGHSENREDIMYMETNPNASSPFSSGYQSLSNADLNTLSLLYKLIPDITNTSKEKFDTSNQFFAPIVMGTEEEISSKKLIEAQNYINAAPDLPNGYIDAASALTDLKQYNKALESLNKALSLSSNDNEKFIIYYNFAVTYMQIKDWKNVIDYAQKAKEIENNSDIEGIIAFAYFSSGDKDRAKSLYEKIMKKDSKNIINAYNLTTIYIKEFNFIKAGKTLNNLIKANPEARNNQMIKRYLIFTWF